MYSLIRLGLSSVFLTALVFGHFDFHERYPERYYSEQKLASVPSDDAAYRLPTNLSPTDYNLTLTPDLTTLTFKGVVDITFDVLIATSSIVLHTDTNWIPIKSLTATLLVNGKTTTVLDPPTVDVTHEFLTFSSPALAPSDIGVLTITYTGILSYDMLGFYISTYNTSTTNYAMAITQFESTHARRAFPCFDEPAYRATFTISINRLSTQNSMSNMPIKSSTPGAASDTFLDTYETSPKMPTYLVAFGVSELGVMSAGTFRVFARSEALADSVTLVTYGQGILDAISKFLNVKYPLTKMDVVAVPDFDAGAMENWGLTTYREKYVLYNENKNSLRDKYGVISVVAHEFGHQWFGDLVTPIWWNCAWLNEAFATYFEYTIPNQLIKEWNSIGSTMYVVGAVQYALGVDVGSPRAMTSDVWTPSEIDDSFDYVIYEKGGSVLRMTEHFLTTPVWKAGLASYLNTNAEGTGTPEELFIALQTASTTLKNVNETLQGWTTQFGYPLVTVKTDNSSSTSSTTYTISQTPYALDNTTTGFTWNIPIAYTSQSEMQFDATQAKTHWHDPSDATTNSLTVTDKGWVIFNVDQIGYYRVNYDASNWKKLKSQLDSNFTAISEINRAQIIDDSLHLARTGDLDYATALGLTQYLPAETALAPWNAFFVNMRFLINVYSNTTTGNGLQEYARNTMQKPFKFLIDNLPNNQGDFLYTTTVQAGGLFACEVGLPDCENAAKTMFDDWRTNPSTEIQPFLKQAVLCTGLRLEPTLDTLLDVWNFYLASDNAAEKLTIMYALGCATNTTAINAYLDEVTNVAANKVRLQDRWIAFRSLAAYQTGVLPVLDYIAANYAKVSDALGPRLSAVISTISAMTTQQSQIDRVNAIIADSKADQGLKDMLTSIVLPAVKKRQLWAATTQAKGLKSWVDNNGKSSASTSVVNIVLVLIATVFVLFK